MKPDIEITRRAFMDFGVYGELPLPSGIELKTVERPWFLNEPSISCIPAGTYTCRPRFFYGGGYDAIEILDVPGRSHILFHVANCPSDVKGCIGVGTDYGYVKNQWAVTNSRQAFRQFMAEMHGEFVLGIAGALPPAAAGYKEV